MMQINANCFLISQELLERNSKGRCIKKELSDSKRLKKNHQTIKHFNP